MDPDPTPVTTPWQEYQAAAQSLDAVRRDAATAAAAGTRVISAARAELAQVRARVGLQRARITDEALRAGVAVPALEPTAQEVAAVGGTMPEGAEQLLEVVRQGRQLLESADAELAGQSTGSPAALWGGSGGSRPGLRNLLVYAPLAVVVFGLQLVLWVILGPASELWWLVLAVALPALAFVLGLVSVGLVFDPDPDGRVRRSPLVGALVCFATLPLLCVGYAVRYFF